MLLVQDFMSLSMVRRASKDTLLEISKTMADLKISSVAITDDQETKQVVGVVTERDIVRGIAKGIDPATKIAESALMSTPVFSIRRDLPIEEAARMMIKCKVRHLFVEDEANVITGIITTTDLARYLRQTTQKQSADDKRQQEKADDEFLSEVWQLYF